MSRLTHASLGACAVLVVASSLTMTGAAHAAIAPAAVVDGPSRDVLGLAGVAMAPDGTGGVAYLKRVGGVPHVFAAQFVNQRWQPPVRVDQGQLYDSGSVAIAAGLRGRLAVVWTQNGGRMYSAFVGPGSRGFDKPILLDASAGAFDQGQPSLSMSPTGTTYVIYRVPNGINNFAAPPGYVAADIRLARFRGGPKWSSLGRMNRNVTIPLPPPNPGNGPKVAADLNGNAVVAWQEPDDKFVPRIYTRRVFGSGLGFTQQASPSTIADKAYNGPADQLALDGGALGEATIAFRLSPGDGTAIKGQHVFSALFPPAAGDSGKVEAARQVDAASGDQKVDGVAVGGAPGNRFGVAYGVDGATWLTTGGERQLDAAQQLDGPSAVAPEPVSVYGAGRSGVTAWRVRVDDSEGIRVREQTSAGPTHVGTVAAPAGGAVEGLAAAGSSYGDALVAFRQGDGVSGTIVATAVDAYPQGFSTVVPDGWVRPKLARITWAAAGDAMAPVTYAVELDGRIVAERLSQLSYRPDPSELGDGTYKIRVIVTDSSGQQRATAPATLRVDGSAPEATLRVRRRRLTVALSDGTKHTTSGVSSSSTTISFGDGRRREGATRVAHVYRRPGTYRVVVQTRDRAGNRIREVRKVHVG